MSDLQMPALDTRAKLPPSGHAVQFYENDSSLIDSLVRQVAPALVAGDTVIIIATGEHREALARELESRGIDLAEAQTCERYIVLDSPETLQRFLVEGWPDAARFEQVIGRLVGQAESSSRGHRLFLYGEMVAHLWAEGKQEATLRLEELWNELADRYSFFLLCGYPLDDFNRSEHSGQVFSICGEHTHVNPIDDPHTNGNGHQTRHMVSPLEVKTRALENEIRLSQERLSLLQDSPAAGTWEMDPFSETFSLSSTAAKLLGIKSGRVLLQSEFLNLIHYSADRDAVAAALKQLQRGRRHFAAGFRLINDESTRILEIRGKTAYNAGSPVVLGVLMDVTERAALVL